MKRKSYDIFVKHCLDNPNLVFDAINYVYHYITNKDSNYDNIEDEINKCIDVLKIGFNNNVNVKIFFDKYSYKIVELLKLKTISDSIYKLLLVLLLDLHRYHNIYKKKCTYDLRELLIELYLHRKK